MISRAFPLFTLLGVCSSIYEIFLITVRDSFQGTKASGHDMWFQLTNKHIPSALSGTCFKGQVIMSNCESVEVGVGLNR